VNEATRSLLCEINRDFYDRFAEDFGSARDHPWPGWKPLLSALPVGALRVLDAGCGNGRFAAFLAESRPGPLAYLGLDASEKLLAQASARGLGDGIRFERRDLLAGDPTAELPRGPYDLVVLFGVLHHVPAFEARRALLLELASRLAADGLLALTVWRFGTSERFRRRVVSWQHYGEARAAPIDLGELEPGDQLLRWGDLASATDDSPVRYCHYADDAEIDRLVGALTRDGQLREASRYRADGQSGDLNEYLMLRRHDG
jgi:SAM-dependent methyltransferase